MDTDSVSFDTMISSNNGKKTIEKLFCESYGASDFLNLDGSQYLFPSGLKSNTMNSEGMVEQQEIEYLYRHSIRKDMYEIELDDGKVIKVTDDHSLGVVRDGEFIEIKPSELLETDEFYVVVENE